MHIDIRLAETSDIPSIFNIRTSVKENHLSLEQLAEIGITYETIERAILEEPCLWIALVNNHPAGFSMADSSEGCVFAAFVSPAYEGIGIGRILMEKAEAFLFNHYTKIWLETARNSRAEDFYTKLGWIATESLPNGDIRFEKYQK
ncbi:GNAT family N-acetyltransferase [Dyadobacter chenwenxiniae]|uniref:GNAT family N-acetyltransferase n=1 Tax=Dyadobacter chenwenxiniae TaxID=2906456 RepID=A0A9X1PKV3_9BACT|nr:GNAT family N-acetyltransferase [Dyadobacter chenwenxiniae]MCF0063197.1 GNAT family N-acetyltransferase [Dyadobacter chenwenxiniae]UON85423.1 GNAT family N-acetyltransferase [Dyadobacter chenwenxiniae]